MAWLMLLLAAVFEIVWAVALKLSHGFTRLLPSAVSLVSMIGSIGLMSLAMRSIPLGTAYMVWTGIGALGAFLVGATWLGEHVTTTKVVAAALILAGLLMMKASSE